MNVLCLDTTNDWILVSIYSLQGGEAKELYEYKGVHPKESSFRLISDVKKALESVSILKPDIVITCKGPGSFTGLRICVSTARNFSQFWQIPALGIDSLELYSYYYFQKYNKPCIIIMDGKRNKVYSGSFDGILYSGSNDTELFKVKELYKNVLDNSNIVTDLKMEKTNINIYSDIPSFKGYLQKNYNWITTIQYEDYNYKNLLPNYLRPSYAEDTPGVKDGQ